MEKNVNVSSSFLDKTLENVKSKIKVTILDSVTGPGPELENKLGKRTEAGEKFTRLDLVSHSFGDEHVLLLGDGDPSEQNFLLETTPPPNDWMKILVGNDMQAIIKSLGITELRLLGCLTALATKGRAAMKKLKQDLAGAGVTEVFGTSNYLSADDFGNGGFKEKPEQSAKLVSCAQIDTPGFDLGPNPPPLPQGAPGTLGLDFDKVPAMSEEELKKLARMKRFVGRFAISQFGAKQTELLLGAIGRANVARGKSLPGLLAVPQREYWIQAQANPPTYRLLHVYFGWRFVCVYSAQLMLKDDTVDDEQNPYANSAIYQVANPDALKSLMTTEFHPTPIKSTFD